MKFARGQLVKCLRSSGGSFTAGNIYEVGGRYYDYWEAYERNEGVVPPNIGIVEDDQGRENGWEVHNFEAAGGPW